MQSYCNYLHHLIYSYTSDSINQGVVLKFVSTGNTHAFLKGEKQLICNRHGKLSTRFPKCF